MARATWSGFISFGLVNVPVQLFTAVRSHDIHFRQLHEGSHAPVKRRRVDAETGEEVPYDEIVKGYEVDDDRYVIVDPEELEALDPEASRMIDIHDFVELEEIDPIYYDRAYYLVPDGEPALKPYRLLTEAMARRGKVAVASFVMRNKEYLAAVRSDGDVLLLSTMHYADEVADPDELGVDVPDTVDVREREVEMAEQLIDDLSRSFDPTRYRDEHQERVREFLDAKAEGEEVELATPERPTGEVVDLMSALERSLQQAGRGGNGGDGEGEEGPREHARTRPAYDEMTKDELYTIAQERDLPGRSGMSKDELVDALRTADGDPAAA